MAPMFEFPAQTSALSYRHLNPSALPTFYTLNITARMTFQNTNQITNHATASNPPMVPQVSF